MKTICVNHHEYGFDDEGGYVVLDEELTLEVEDRAVIGKLAFPVIEIVQWEVGPTARLTEEAVRLDKDEWKKVVADCPLHITTKGT